MRGSEKGEEGIGGKERGCMEGEGEGMHGR